MNLHRLCLALGAAGLLLASPVVGSAEHSRDFARSGPANASGRVIVTYKQTRASALSARIQSASQASTPLREAQTLNQRHGLDLRDGRTIAPGTQVLTSATLSNERLLQTLAADPDVASVSIDQWRHPHAAPNDPLYADGQTAATPTAGQWYLRAPSGAVVSSINAEGAWNTTTGSSSIVVAVLDTGVRPEHPDLIGKLLPGYDFVQTAATGNDGDAAEGDASDPGDWVSLSDKSTRNFSTCTVTNSSWHGTQTASVIGAATNNGAGMASVGRHVRLLPVRVLGKCGGYDSDIISGMRWAAGLSVTGVPTNPHPARVLNLSLGSSGACDSGTSTTYTDTIATLNGLGVVVVVSAGNDDLAVNAPANCAGAIAVAGLRHAGSKSDFSSLGSAVALAAPAGNCVNDTLPCVYPIIGATNSGTNGPVSSTYTDGFDYAIGTSFSAPMVAGTAALMLSVNPNLPASQVRSLLINSSRTFPTTGGSAGIATCAAPGTTKQEECYCTTTTCGAGMLDTQAAVQAAAAGRAVAHLGGTRPLVAPGNSVVIDGSSSMPASGATLSTYLWEVIDGVSLSTISSANNASSVTLNTLSTTTSGTFTVRLTVTDSLGNTGSATQVFTVGTAPSIVTATSATTNSATAEGGGGGGGGALDLGWAALALLGSLVAWRGRPSRNARR